jgi:hypothetical protein
MYKSRDEMWTDRVYRQAYGEDVGYDSKVGGPAVRVGVGKIETGPSNPRATIPTGQISDISAPIQSIPAAFATETVMPARLQSKTVDDYSTAEQKSALRAQAQLKNYLNKVNTGQLK